MTGAQALIARMAAPWEHELLYRFFNAVTKADGLRINVASDRKVFVLRDADTKQVIARCPTIMEVELELTNCALVRRLKTACPVTP